MHGGNIYSGKIKYDFSVNLNPYMPTENIVNAIRDSIVSVTNYPEYDSDRLTTSISEKLCINKEYITVSAGASEAITAITRAINADSGIIFAPAFSGYERALESCGVSDIEYRLCEDSDIDEVIENDGKKVLYFLASPSNPIGKLIPKSQIIELYKKIKDSNGYLILDECFINLSDNPQNTLITDISEDTDFYDRLIIVRSFTKTYSIPGIRLGYCVCTNSHLNEIIQINMPEWNISTIASEAGIACLKEDLLECGKFIQDSRREMCSKLRELGLKVYDSNSVYVVFQTEIDMYKRLLEKGILIRDCSDYKGLGKGYYRVSVKKTEDNMMLLNAIKEVCDGR